MCVKFKKDSEITLYDVSQPLELQMDGAQEIVIEYRPRDASVIKFVKEIEKMTKEGLDSYPIITVKHNNNITGIKVKKKIQKISNDITLNKLVKLMTISHYEADKKLEEMATMCNVMCNTDRK